MSPNNEYVWPCCNLVDSAMDKATGGASALSNFYVGTKALALTLEWLSSCTWALKAFVELNSCVD